MTSINEFVFVLLVLASEFIPVFSLFVFAESFSFLCSVLQTIVCTLFHFDIILSVLRFAVSNYPFDIYF